MHMTGSHHRTAGPRPAPALSVHGPGPGEVTIGALTAGGCALLLFVNEDCPTSAMTLRRLGPLARAWEEAGLTSTAVFEDPLEIAVRVARRLGWAGRVVSEDPPYETSRVYQLVSVPTAVLVDRAGTIAGTVTGWDRAALVALIEEAGALLGTELAVPEAIEPLLKPGCSSKAAIDPELAAAMSAPAGTAAATAGYLSASSRPTWARRRWSGSRPARCWRAAARPTSRSSSRPPRRRSIPRSTCTARR